MDENLKKAIEKGRAKKAAKLRESRAASDAKTSEHQKYINKYLPEARKWIKNKLFKQIAQAEADFQNYSSRNIPLSDSEDGIPAEAIFQAAKKVKGLKPRVEYPSIYENAEFVGTGDAQYSIEWESLDPNDHRNDR
jgi:hypothetical protein